MTERCLNCLWGRLVSEGKTNSLGKYEIRDIMVRSCLVRYLIPSPTVATSNEGKKAVCINPDKFYPHGPTNNI